MDFLFEYLITKGGIYGLLLAFAIAFIVWRERTFASGGKPAKKKESELDALLLHTKEIKYSQQASKEKIDEIAEMIESFKDINEKNHDRIEKLTEQLQQVNDERVDELKDLLQEYSKTMNELSLALEKVKFVLKTKLDLE